MQYTVKKYSVEVMLLLLLGCLFYCSLGYTAEYKADSWYLWQTRWTPAVAQAVTDELQKSSSRFYFLAGEIHGSADGKKMRFQPGAICHIEDCIPVSKRIAVYRIKTSVLKQFPVEKIADFLQKQILKTRTQNAVQIDLDAPESQIKQYALLMQTLRKKLPDSELSATTLICHLSVKDFGLLANACDFFVLQVHGADFGRAAELMTGKQAIPAIQKAMQFRKPFAVALPCYSYAVQHDPDTGKILYIRAETGPVPPEMNQETLLQANRTDVAQTVRAIRKSQQKKNSFLKGIIWFRLPVKGDRYCLDRNSVRFLQKGMTYPENLLLTWEKNAQNTEILYLENQGIQGLRKAEITLPSAELDDWDVLQKWTGKHHNSNVIFQGQIPPPGTRQPILWIRRINPDSPTIKCAWSWPGKNDSKEKK